MKQNLPAEETKFQVVDKQPPSKPASPAEIPLWLATSFVLGVVSLVSLIYYFFTRRSSPTPGREHAEPSQAPGQIQAEEITHEGLDIIKSKPVFAAPSDIQQTEQNTNAGMGWTEVSSTLSNLSADQIKTGVFSIIGTLAALAIAYFAQGVFDSITGAGTLRNWVWLISMSESNRQWLGAGIYLIALLVWVFSAPPMRSIDSIVNSSKSDAGENRYPPIRTFFLATGIVVYFIAVISFLMNDESAFVRLMWGFGLVCFILSQLPYKNSHPEAEESPAFRWQNWLVLALILLVGFWLRFYQIATIPDDLHGDMASHGWVARDFLLGKQHDIFGFGWTATPTIGFLPAFLTMAVFGNNIFGMQMAAVIGGTFSLFAVYLLTWRLFNSHRLATLTTIIVAINVVHIHFYRLFNMEPWPLSNFAIFLLIDGFKSRRFTSFGLAGVFIGFSLLMYTSGRALPFILIVFVLYALLFQRKWITQNLWGFVALVGGIIITMGPALVYYLISWDSFIARSREVYLFSEGVMAHLLNKYNTDSMLTVLLTQIKLSLLMFHQSTDTSSQFGYPHPMFSSLISPLIILGLGFAIRRWKQAGMAFVLIWLAMVMVLGSILTIDAPFWPRLVGIIPAAALLIAMAIEQILEMGRKVLGSQSVRFILPVVVIFLATVGYLDWDRYYQFVKDSGSPSTLTGRYIGRLPDDVTACGITNPPLSVRETSFLAWPHKLVDIAPDAPDSDLEKCTGSSIVWAVAPEYIGRLDAIRARWPNGILDERFMPRFNYTMTFYLVGVQPPESQPEKTFHLPPWFSIIASLILAGILIWYVFRRVPLKIPHELPFKRNAGSQPLVSTLDMPRQSPPSTPKRNMFADFIDWYDEVKSFTFPAVTPKLVASILLPPVAVGLAYFAQTFLDQWSGAGLHLQIESLYIKSEGLRLAVASLTFVVAALLWTFTTAVRENDFSSGQTTHGESISQPTLGSPIQIVGIFLTISSMVLYIVMGENNLVRWLWLAGLGVFFASLFIKSQTGMTVQRDESPAFRWFHWVILASLLALAFALRVYRLYDVPLDLSTDMASVGIYARDYLFGLEKHIFGTGWYYMPRITFIPYMASMAVAGNNLFGLYFATVVMGTLNVLGTYLFVWRLFDRHRLALLTALLITINPAHINFSRITSYMDPWFLGFFGLYFFVDGLKGRRWISLALAGVFTGFTLVSYPSGRAIIPLIFIGLACAWFFRRKWVTENYKGLVWMLLGILITLGPNLVYFITDWSVYMQRSREVLITNPGVTQHLEYTYEVDSFWLVLWEQIKRSVLLFNYYTDRSAQFSYPHPMFNSYVSPLLLLGFGMSLYRWKKPEFLFLVSSFVSMLVIGSILTDNAPTWCRLVGIIPLAALLIALVLDEFVNLLERLSLKPFVPLLIIGLAVFLWQLGTLDWKIYLIDVTNEDITRPEVHVARYLDTLPDEVTACGITDEYLINQEEIRFMGWPRSILVVPADTPTLVHELCPGKNVVWILAPVYKDRLSELRIKWPGGTAEDHITKNGWHVFTSYLVANETSP
ncbi:hypothetical protein ANAEL_01294 [Anaerolineales bacterium]|nr:hypothetical protein ANAEL_01294 [Anaerolineales bacterium]